jgi:hypothetical protein
VDALTYNPMPVVATISVDRSGRAGGGTATILGRGFADLDPGEVVVAFGSGATDDVDVVSDEELTVVIPAKPDDAPAFERIDVSVTTANGTGVLPRVFTYSAPGYLATSGRGGQSLHYIDPVTFERRQITGNLPQRFPSMAVAPDGRLLAVTRCCSFTVGVLDPLAGTFTPIGNAGQNIRDLVTVGDTVYGYTQSDRLVTIDTETGAATVVADVALGMSGQHATIAPRDETTIYGIDSLNSSVLKIISLADATTTDGPTLTGPDLNPHAAFLVEGQLYVVGHSQSSGSQAYRIDVEEGTVTLETTYDRNLHAISTTPPSFD